MRLTDLARACAGLFLFLALMLPVAAIAAPPVLTAASPNEGPNWGSTFVVLTGENLSSVTSVTFGGVPAQYFSAMNDNEVWASTAAAPAGATEVTLTTPDGSASLPFTYVAVQPRVTSVQPHRGPSGRMVTVYGDGFTGATSVKFGGVEASTFFVNDETSISAWPAPSSPGTFAVTVTTPVGESTRADGYTVVAKPTLVSIEPNVVPTSGGPIVLEGTDLEGVWSVTVDGASAPSVLGFDTQIYTTAPPHAAGMVRVEVTSDGGSESRWITYADAPAITSLSPSVGGSGTQVVTLTGTGFTGATSVSVGGASVAYLVMNDTVIEAYFSGSPGTHDVSVTAPGGIAVLPQAYAIVDTPSVTDIAPYNVPTAGGTLVTITGQHLMYAADITVDGIDVTASATISDTEITFTTPPHAAGPIIVSFVTPGGSGAHGLNYVSPPTLTSLDPNVGPAAGGNLVTIRGSAFIEGSQARFDGVPVTSTFGGDPTEIVAMAPAHAAGVVDVSVTTPGGTTSTLPYTFVAAPTVMSASPDAGPTVGGTTVSLTGTGFMQGMWVVVNGMYASGVTVHSPTNLSFTLPSNPPGPATITVITVGGTDNFASGFTYLEPPTATGLSASIGPSVGGTTVSLSGTNFVAATTVLVGGTPATDVTLISPTTISFVTPAHVAGSVDVQVITGGGEATVSSAFEYVDAPTISRVSPPDGPTGGGGAYIGVTGTNFTHNPVILIDGVAPSAIEYEGTTKLHLLPAPHARGPVLITITTPGGTASAAFEYVDPPTITSVSPSSGPVAGHTYVTVTGTNLSRTHYLDWGDAYMGVANISDTEIAFYSRPRPAGVQQILLRTSGGTATISFTYVDPPTITSVSPSDAPVTGGTTATVAGTNFTAETQITVDGTAAATTYVNSSEVSFVTPAHSEGTFAVQVTTPGGAATLASALTYRPVPVIDSVLPNLGPIAGGETVRITGSGFGTMTSVTFAGVAATVTSASDTEVEVVTPAVTSPVHADVVLTTTVGSATQQTAYNYLGVPTVTSATPNAGPVSGFTTVTITGANLMHATSVMFGTIAASFTVDSDTQITATTPAQDQATVDIIVTSPGGSGSLASGFAYHAPPRLNNIFHYTHSPLWGGELVSIFGNNLAGVTSLKFGGVEATIQRARPEDIVAWVPPHAAGVVDVEVTTPGGSDTLVGALTYVAPPTVTSLSPSRGPTAGGSTIVLTGTNLTTTNVVRFNSSWAQFTVVSDTQVTAVLPPGEAGSAIFRLETAGGSFNLWTTFTYVAPPTLGAPSPAAGPAAGGQTVVLTGTDLLEASSVMFGGVPASSFTVDNNTQITAIAPAHAAGLVDIAVTATGGSVTRTGAYTYVAAPAIASASPGMGPLTGGAVVLTGTDLTGATAVTFDGVAATSFTVDSDTQITATAPPRSAGAIVVAVTTIGGTGTLGYAYLEAPTLISASPAIGPTAGGTIVVLTGTNLLNASAVTFGGAPAAAYTIDSDTQITATTPAGSAGAAAIAVTTAGGTATASNPFTYVAQPNFANVLPDLFPTTGKNLILVGSGFIGVTNVTFGGIPAVSFTVVDDHRINAHSPPLSAGSHVITVTSPGGSSSRSQEFTIPPVLASISPDAGSIYGGTSLTLSGTSLGSVIQIVVDGTPTSYSIVNDNTITLTAPAHPAGPVTISLMNPGGISFRPYTYVFPPTLSSAAPSSGLAAGGASVVLTGADLLNATAVSFGGTPATSFTVDSATQITATTPAGVGGGADIVVTTAGGSATLADGFTYIPVPTLSAASPDVGPLAGGTNVTLTGTGLTGASAVTFGGSPAGGFTVISDTIITATAPAHVAGAVDIAVTTPGGAGTLPSGFTYVGAPTLGSISPDHGPAAGGTAVALTGTNLSTTTAITFDGAPATFTIDSDSQVTASAPAHARGPVAIGVITAGGSATLAAVFTYRDPPTLSSASPAFGPTYGGTSVTLAGVGFAGARAVTFGGTPANWFTVDSDTQITAAAPAHAEGAVAIEVTSVGGTGTLNSAFTYRTPPTLSSTSPNSGTKAGGTSVTLTGSGFADVSAVVFSGVPAPSFTVDSDTQITVVTPAQGTGAATIEVVTSGGTASLVAGFTYLLDTETWVSIYGDDANECTRTQPCKTFAGAIAKTAAGGTVGCLDAGGRGAFTVTQSVTIACEGVAGVMYGGTHGVTVSAGPTDIVVLRGIDLDSAAAAPGLNGIRFLSGGALHIENSVIRDSGASGHANGILFAPGSGTPELHVSNSRITGHGIGAEGAGIQIAPTGSAGAKVVIENTVIAKNTLGVRANSAATTGTIDVAISKSSATGAAYHGFVALGLGGQVRMMLKDVVSSNNAGEGIRAMGAHATIRIGGALVTRNGTGIVIGAGGTVLSYGTNQINDNANDGTTPAVIGRK